eukprot:gene3367-3852_t
MAEYRSLESKLDDVERLAHKSLHQRKVQCSAVLVVALAPFRLPSPPTASPGSHVLRSKVFDRCAAVASSRS